MQTIAMINIDDGRPGITDKQRAALFWRDGRIWVHGGQEEHPREGTGCAEAEAADIIYQLYGRDGAGVWDLRWEADGVSS